MASGWHNSVFNFCPKTPSLFLPLISGEESLQTEYSRQEGVRKSINITHFHNIKYLS